MSRRRRIVSKRTMPLWVIIIIAVIGLAQQQNWFKPITNTATKSQPGMYSISRFIDGDTIAVNMNGKVEEVRFIGVDTPETHKPNTPVQCYGPAAAAYTKNIIGTKSVRLEADPLNTNRDRYGRLLRYVYLPDGTLLNEQLIKNGYAFAYTQFPFGKKATFIADQAAADSAAKGLWGNCKPYQQPNGRWQSNNQ